MYINMPIMNHMDNFAHLKDFAFMFSDLTLLVDMRLPKNWGPLELFISWPWTFVKVFYCTYMYNMIPFLSVQSINPNPDPRPRPPTPDPRP